MWIIARDEILKESRLGQDDVIFGGAVGQGTEGTRQ